MTTTTSNHPDQTVRSVAFVSLGCPKNLVDSEKMLGLLAEAGITPVPFDEEDFEGADAVVVNTCGFLEASKEESMSEITRAAELKQQGIIKRLVVAGCLVQRHRAKMLEWCPDIDALIGVFDRDKILEAVNPTGLNRTSGTTSRGSGAADSPDSDSANSPDIVTHPLPVFSSIASNATLARQARQLDEAQTPGYFEDDSARLRLTPRHYAYLRMSEGCNQNCAFCTIPSIRGKMRSKAPHRIAEELKELLHDGAYEINLIGQDTTSYGDDIGYAAGLSGLLRHLNDTIDQTTVGQGAWLRLMYAYPSKFTDEMIDTIAALPNVVKYIDMPLQHINDQVLDNMRRHTSRKLIETLLGKLRDRVVGPDGPIAIRTTFICGFPGETDEQHQELVDFVRDFGFDNMGVFPYSPEPGTPAGTMYEQGNAIPDDLVQARVDELMQAQQQVVFARNDQLAEDNATFDVLIEQDTGAEVQPTPGVTTGGRLYDGRTYAQAPQIDALTKVVAKTDLAPGEIVRCSVVACDGYDLIAVPVEEKNTAVKLNILS